MGEAGSDVRAALCAPASAAVRELEADWLPLRACPSAAAAGLASHQVLPLSRPQPGGAAVCCAVHRFAVRGGLAAELSGGLVEEAAASGAAAGREARSFVPLAGFTAACAGGAVVPATAGGARAAAALAGVVEAGALAAERAECAAAGADPP
eukprot:CAMPEP_0183802320 /NCGR_PEP_ID=MMETSP0803_2-20130417/30066_1 /TAXON_ID=195967 /ORGANISM="Crustomastix stigmata, Strain CCMP3273" /LENGTH=151 /DNA_ID=CAMNT_0026047053 /DNA_START=88 /DNA_END=540 /DNA_ORIENTATION=+